MSNATTSMSTIENNGSLIGRPSKGSRTNMGIPSGISIVIGMIIGSGIFSTPGFVWQLVGSPGMALIMWVVGGFVSYLGTLCYVELGTMLPKSGGEQAYLAYAFKRPRELFSFLFCWCTIICIQPNCVSANAVVFGSYILYAIYGAPSELPDNSLKQNYDWYSRGIGLFIATAITLVCIVSTKWALRMQNGITFVKIITLLVFAITGVVILAGGAPSIPNAGNWDKMFEGTSTDVSNYANAMFSVFWAFGGWNALNFCVGELKNPNILAGTFSNIVFGHYFGRVGLPILIAICTYGTLAATIFTASRVIHIAAKENYFPFARFFSQVNTNYGTPVNALLFNWVISVVFMIAPPPGKAFDFLITMSGYPQSLFFGFTVAGLIVLRKTEPEKERPFRVWLIGIPCWYIIVIHKGNTRRAWSEFTSSMRINTPTTKKISQDILPS
ncbi:amino acid permease-domain-containing protein [Syncephalis fuscata]|nr:amino acid permease-domain-containing protein [Syncephalis fuscata]